MKRKKAIRIAVIALVIILVAFMALMPILSYLVYAQDVWGAVTEKEIALDDSLTLSSGIYRQYAADDRFTENILTYTPGGATTPLAVYGHDIYGAASLKTAARYAEEETGLRVMAAVNGDFFTVATGVAVGLVVREGTLRTSDDGERYALSFDKDGNAQIGISELNITVGSDKFDSPLEHIHLNKVLGASSGAVLYDASFEATNKNTAMKHSVYLTVKSGELKVGGTVTCEVSYVTDAAWEDNLRNGYLVLAVQDDTYYTNHLNAIASLEAGDIVTIAIDGSDALKNAENAIGGGDLLVENGTSVAPGGSTRAPRTAAGIRKDGTVLFYTVDGRQTGYSIGMTYRELADRMIELGCVTALNLDGGGSTTLEAIYPGDSALSLVNKPSGGSLRSCANYILFMSDRKATGNAQHLHLYPYGETVLAGASFAFSVKATDKAYYPVSISSGTVKYSAGSIGQMSGNIFTAGSKAGTGTVTATSGTAKGSTTVRVVERVDGITVLSQAAGTEMSRMTIAVGDSIDLTAKAYIEKVEIIAADTSFKWSCTGNIGTITDTGVFTASDNNGEGTIVCAVGDTAYTVDVKVVSEGALLADFETGEATYNNRVGSGMTGTVLSTNRELVRFGQKSLELDYDFGLTQNGDEATYPLNLKLNRNATQLNFWVYGDNSGHALSVEFGTFGGFRTVQAGTLDYTGWKQFYLDVPSGAETVTNLILSGEGSASGAIYIDQIISSRGEYVDHEAPTVELSVSGRTLTGLIHDDTDGEIPKDRVKATYDGNELALNYSVTGQSFTVQLPAADTYDHWVAVTVQDLSGNRSRAFLVLEAEKKTDTSDAESGSVYAEDVPFIDTAGHWSEMYENYLYQQGLTEGNPTPEGPVYRPGENMTRAEIAVMLARWLRVEGKYDDVVLPYTDLDQIEDWALSAAKALYALGVIQGSTNADGSVSFLPDGYLSREQIMTMIGRVQDKGYTESDMDFYDADKVSDWALPYVKSLVGQKVISGDAGWLRPLDPVKRGEAAKIICCLY